MESKAGMISYLRFVYGSDKGATKTGDMFNNSLYHGKSDVNYSGADIDGEILVAGTNGFLMYNPVVPGTLTLADENGNTATDDGAGSITLGSNTLTIDYATGALTGTIASGVSATYRYNNEDVQYGNATNPQGVEVPQINLELAQLPVFAQSRKLAAYWGFDAAYDLKKQLTCKLHLITSC